MVLLTVRNTVSTVPTVYQTLTGQTPRKSADAYLGTVNSCYMCGCRQLTARLVSGGMQTA